MEEMKVQEKEQEKINEEKKQQMYVNPNKKRKMVEINGIYYPEGYSPMADRTRPQPKQEPVVKKPTLEPLQDKWAREAKEKAKAEELKEMKLMIQSQKGGDIQAREQMAL